MRSTQYPGQEAIPASEHEGRMMPMPKDPYNTTPEESQAAVMAKGRKRGKAAEALVALCRAAHDFEA